MSKDFDLDGIDGEQIGRLMELLARSDVTELEIEQGEHSLSLKRTLRQRSSEQDAPGLPYSEDRDEPAVVVAPAVGVFYRSERRSGPPKVEAGAKIKAGEVLGRIEVMGIPHHVFSTHDGVVEDFLVEDGQAVEYGQPLVALKAS